MDGKRCSCPIDEHFPTCFVLLPQHQVELRPPPLIRVTESRVEIAVRLGLPAFFPQQLQGHVLAAAYLLVDRREVGSRTRWVLLRDAGSPAREQHRFYPRLVPVFGEWPRDLRRLGVLQIVVNRADPDRAISPDLPVGLSSYRRRRTSFSFCMDGPWPALGSFLGGFIVSVLMSSAAKPSKTFRASRKPFRGGRKPFAFSPESLFAFSRECRSPSPRTRFRVCPGIPNMLP